MQMTILSAVTISGVIFMFGGSLAITAQETVLIPNDIRKDDSSIAMYRHRYAKCQDEVELS